MDARGRAPCRRLLGDLSRPPRALPAEAQHRQPGLSHYDRPQLKKLGPDASAILAQKGSLVYVRIQIQGKKHANVRVDEVSYDATSRQPFDTNQPDGFRADTPNDQWIVPEWVPNPDPTEHRRFFVRLRLFDDKVMLAFADSNPITA